VRVIPHRFRGRRGVGWLGAGRVIAGLSAGFALMAVGLEGLRNDVLGLHEPPALVAGSARPELIPGVQAPAFTGGIAAGSPRSAAVAPVRPGAPLSPSARATPLRAAPRSAVRPAASLVVVGGPEQQVVAALPQTRAALRDSDHDGLPDAVERRLGTNPHSADTDGDGMPDGWEVRYGLNPRNDLDATADPDHDGVDNLNEFRTGSNPRLADSDHDGIPDGADDSDHDGLPNAVEQKLGLDPSQPSTPPSDRDLARTARNVAAPAPTFDVLSTGDPAAMPPVKAGACTPGMSSGLAGVAIRPHHTGDGVTQCTVSPPTVDDPCFVTVEITYTFRTLIPWPLIPNTANFDRSTTMRLFY